MKKKRATYDSQELQSIVGERDGWHCHYCGCELVHSGMYAYMDTAGMNIGGTVITFEYLVENNYTTWEKVELYQSGIKPATIDHVIPLSAGGNAKDPSNTVLACSRCNSRKHKKGYLDFIQTFRGNQGQD